CTVGGLVRSQRVSRVILSGALLVVAVTAAFLLSMALIALTGGSAISAASAMLQGSVESTASLMTSLQRATPLLLVAIGTVVAGRAGLINVGQEGQVLVGAVAGTAFGLYVLGSGWPGQDAAGGRARRRGLGRHRRCPAYLGPGLRDGEHAAAQLRRDPAGLLPG